LLRIRLRRVGKKKRPAYRVVVADSRAPRDGAFIETIGLYDPLTEPATINIDQEKAERWLKQGAQPSDTVAKLLIRQGLLEAKAPVTKAPETKRPKAEIPETETPETGTPETGTPETPAEPESSDSE
jgi:small subunit ribosomal protein S16